MSRLLWCAFERDPLFRYLFRSRWYAGRVVPLLFGAQARDALRHGHIDVAAADRQPLAAAIWLSPGHFPPTARRILAGLPAYLPLGTLFLDRLPDLLRLTRAAAAGPDEPHWHLEYLAVDPDRQGQGVGGQVLGFGLRRADEAGFACGLETSNERAIALYRRLGFEVRDETRPFRSGPPVWSMWRPASPILLAATPAGDGAPAGEMEPAPAAAPAPGTEPAPGTMGSSPHGIRRRAVLAAAGAGAAGFAAGWLVRPAAVGRLPGEDVGALYHRASAPGFMDALGALVTWGAQPPPTKEYPGAARFELPLVTAPPELSVAAAIERRRSLRDYAGRPLTTGELSWLLDAATGITGPGGLRAAPSAGAQYPIETYVAITRVEGLEPGIYHYAPADHALERVRTGTFGGHLVIAGLGQELLGQAPVVLVLSAIFQRLRWRYRERAYRFALIETGHIGQNVYLAAEAAGLGACAVGSFLDDAVNRLLEIDGVDEAALMLLPVGPR